MVIFTQRGPHRDDKMNGLSQICMKETKYNAKGIWLKDEHAKMCTHLLTFADFCECQICGTHMNPITQPCSLSEESIHKKKQQLDFKMGFHLGTSQIKMQTWIMHDKFIYKKMYLVKTSN